MEVEVLSFELCSEVQTFFKHFHRSSEHLIPRACKQNVEWSVESGFNSEVLYLAFLAQCNRLEGDNVEQS